MKNIFWLLLIVLLSSSCEFRKPDIENVEKTKMEIVDPERSYYPIIRGSELTASYKFYNRGNEPLIIYDVQASCGCIEVEFPSSSIGKDDFGFINIDYDSAKNIGYVEFYITIVANTEKDVFSTIKFDLTVVTSPHYTQDYEEIYLDRRKKKLAGEVDGDLTEQGYMTPDETKTVR
ncbi:DUF1573 domain-containing protein [Polaribacter ponticola]|uniref:DUF1573 domain-containing protein n=1 Tax=Polaribacter ponticola TaxID=2978475 RepID=A0ABT5S5Y1_9FLAO|nr:DUF1573 domain-containing protein [Polaribacter sp. MSW5]MDD7913020.1 DUF1573 domain-containing protein [Polaribacter sp. MSW5]